MHNVGIIDPRIVEVCATDHRVAKEISNDKKGNRHPSHIYTHYFYLRKRSISAESYLLARLADSAALNSLIATINCTAAELSNTPDSNLARGIILNCLTSISSHGLKAASEKGEFIKVFRLDAEGFRTAVAARCILASKTEFLLDIPELLHLTQISARGTLFVPIPTATNSAKSVSVKVDNVLAQTTKSIAALIQKLIGSQQKPQKWLPVELMGDAQSRFT